MAYNKRVDYQKTLRALLRFNGNRKQAARYLGILPETVRKHVKVLQSMGFDVPGGGKNYNYRGKCEPYEPTPAQIRLQSIRLRELALRVKRMEE